MDNSRHTVKNFLSDEKTNAANNCKHFKKLNYVNKAVFEIELVEAKIEHIKSILVWFLIYKIAKLRMLELY